MKKLLVLFAVLFFSIQGFSQFGRFVDSSQLEILPLDSVTNKIDFQGVVRIDSLSKQQIFDRASLWLKGFSEVGWIKKTSTDFETGKLKGIAYFAGSTGKGFLKVDFIENFDIEITVKEGRYRYEMTNFTAHTDMSGVFDLTEWYFDPKHKRRDGSFANGPGAYIHTASIAGQLFSKSLVEEIATNKLKEATKIDKDNF